LTARRQRRIPAPPVRGTASQPPDADTCTSPPPHLRPVRGHRGIHLRCHRARPWSAFVESPASRGDDRDDPRTDETPSVERPVTLSVPLPRWTSRVRTPSPAHDSSVLNGPLAHRSRRRTPAHRALLRTDDLADCRSAVVRQWPARATAAACLGPAGLSLGGPGYRPHRKTSRPCTLPPCLRSIDHLAGPGSSDRHAADLSLHADTPAGHLTSPDLISAGRR
jgi:hypothetical protein